MAVTEEREEKVFVHSPCVLIQGDIPEVRKRPNKHNPLLGLSSLGMDYGLFPAPLKLLVLLPGALLLVVGMLPLEAAAPLLLLPLLL